MQQPFQSHQFSDDDGNPAGGQTFGPGFVIAWQNGPLATDVQPGECVVSPLAHSLGKSHDDDLGPCRRDPNGAFVETIIAAARDRLEFYQRSKFECEENAEAIDHLTRALTILQSRTAKREQRGVEGTHEA